MRLRSGLADGVFLLLALTPLASATTIGSSLDPPNIDFRTATFDACDNSAGIPGCTVGGITITATSNIFHDNADHLDGFGVRGGNEDDEIDHTEVLQIEFLAARLLSGVWFTDLFVAIDGGPDNEEAAVELFDALNVSLGVFSHAGTDLPFVTNGEDFLSFGGPLLVKRAVFSSVDEENDEYSVAGFTTVVPEPGSITLFGSGLLALALMVRRSRSEAIVRRHRRACRIAPIRS